MTVEKQAARYFREQADQARKDGDHKYAETMERRAAEWANG